MTVAFCIYGHSNRTTLNMFINPLDFQLRQRIKMHFTKSDVKINPVSNGLRNVNMYAISIGVIYRIA